MNKRTLDKYRQHLATAKDAQPDAQTDLKVIAVLNKYKAPNVDSEWVKHWALGISKALAAFAHNQDKEVNRNSDIDIKLIIEEYERLEALSTEALDILGEHAYNPEISKHLKELKETSAGVISMFEQGFEIGKLINKDQKGEPVKKSRYDLYLTIMSGWKICKSNFEGIPKRTINNEREPCGEYYNYLADIFNITPDTRLYVSIDEAHKQMIKMDKNEQAAQNKLLELMQDRQALANVIRPMGV